MSEFKFFIYGESVVKINEDGSLIFVDGVKRKYKSGTVWIEEKAVGVSALLNMGWNKPMKVNHLTSDQDKKDIGRMLAFGATAQEIIDQYKISESTIDRIRKRYDRNFLYLVQRGKRYSRDTRIQVKEMISNGRSMRSISIEYGISEFTLNKWKKMSREQLENIKDGYNNLSHLKRRK